MGVGGLDTWKDGRDIYDNIQLIYKYPKNQKLVYSSITTNQHLPILNSTRPEFGEIIMGTAGALDMTVGDGESTMPTALWYREPAKVYLSRLARVKRALPRRAPPTHWAVRRKVCRSRWPPIS